MAKPKQKRATRPATAGTPSTAQPDPRTAYRSQDAWTRQDYILMALIFAMTIIAYIPAVRATYIWDDNDYVINNMTLRSLGGLRDIWFKPSATPQYYPIVHTTFWIEYHLWGLLWFGYHMVNVLVHSTSAVLLWRLMKRLAVPGAWLAGAILAVHPVHVETVAWVTEHKNVLSLVFYLLSAHAWVSFSRIDGREAEAAADSKSRKRSTTTGEQWNFYALSLLFFLLSLFSKTVSCSLPAAILLITYWKRGRITLRDVQLLVPFFILGAGMGIFTAHMEKEHVLAEGDEWNLSFLDRSLIAGQLVWFYAWKLVWPHPLMFFYPRWVLNARVWWQVLLPLANFVTIGALWGLRNKIGRGPLVMFLFFIGTLFPALGFFNVYPMRYSWAADHFQYHASIGLIALFAAGAALLWHRFVRLPDLAALACSMVLLATLGTLTFKQSRMYYSAETLWVRTLEQNPVAWNVQNNLGHIREEQGKADEAFEHYSEAVRLNPNDGILKGNLANSLYTRGKTAEAQEMYREAIRQKSDWAQVHVNFGSMLAAQNRIDEAVAEYAEAVRVMEKKNSLAPEAQFKWASALLKQGKLQEAENHYKEALKSQKATASMYYAYGNLLEKLNRPKEAIAPYKKAVSLKPDLKMAQDRLKALEKI